MCQTNEDIVVAANTEEFVTLEGKHTGKPFQIRTHSYGVLVPDRDHPLCAVSVSDSTLSINLWTGCPMQCAYCQVQGSFIDLADNGRIATQPMLRSRFSIDEIVDALIAHPFFVKDRSTISIGTSCTEPFAPGKVVESTFEIMRAFVSRGMRNSFWIVTKAGVPAGYKQELAHIVSCTRGILISICWADNPPNVEPARVNRFLHCEDAKDAGAVVSWYMRPIVPEWSGTPERIEMMMLWVANRYRDAISMIIPGGLRWTEGVEYGLEAHGVPMPELTREDNAKVTLDGVWETIQRLGEQHFPRAQIYRRSSCAISKMLSVPSVTSINLHDREGCENSRCPTRQRQICARCPASRVDIAGAQNVADRFRIQVKVTAINSDHTIVTAPPLDTLTYAIRLTFLSGLAAESDHGA